MLDALLLPKSKQLQRKVGITVLLFKYLSPAGARIALANDESLALRFALPRTYNDPYELFLRPEPPLGDPEERAFFKFFLAEVLETPVTCLSRRPDSVVMWAHYAKEASGVCLAFDEDALADSFEAVFIDDVVYSDAPATIDSCFVRYAFATGKRRHTFRLLAIANRSAYFVKRSDWQYEAERRLVVTPDAVTDREGHLIADVSLNALRFIILGPKTPADLRDLVGLRSEGRDISVLEMKAGRKTYEPFFLGAQSTFRWTGGEFAPADAACTTCGEPARLLQENDQCEWCGISDEIQRSAPLRSQLVSTLHFGIDHGIPLEFDGLRPRGRRFKQPQE